MKADVERKDFESQVLAYGISKGLQEAYTSPCNR